MVVVVFCCGGGGGGGGGEYTESQHADGDKSCISTFVLQLIKTRPPETSVSRSPRY